MLYAAFLLASLSLHGSSSAQPVVDGASSVLQLRLLISSNQKQLDAIKSTGTPPPLAARNLAIFHQALQDTLQLKFKLENDCSYDGFYNALFTATSSYILEGLYGLPVDESLSFNPCKKVIRFARKSSLSALKIRENDGSAPPTFTPDTAIITGPEVPGIWIPTPPGNLPNLLPYWGSVKPFSIKDVKECGATRSPPTVNSEKYLKHENEVRELGNYTSVSRTADQTDIANFWAGGPFTPPGIWNLIAQKLVVQEAVAWERAVEVFRVMNMALADAGICAWYIKNQKNFWRPITAIQKKDPSWTPLLTTPPFPEYVSGHSTFSTAAATVLKGMGLSKPFALSYLGLERQFKTPEQAAEEAGKSRIYGGIHFQSGNEDGKFIGAVIGNAALNDQGVIAEMVTSSSVRVR